MRASFAAVLVVLVAVSGVRANTLWNNYGSGYVQGYSSTPTHENADDFVLGGSSAITSANWTGAYFNNTLPTDNFSVRIFGDSGGNPTVNPIDVLAGAITRTDAHTTLFGREVYDYSISLSTPLTLGAGTYYFSVIDSPTSDAFFWAVVSDTGGNFWVRDTPLPGVWIENNSPPTPSEMAFSVEGTAVPVPSSVWGGLVLFAGLGLVTALRRRPVLV
jgi:hypothetical protein